MARSFADPWTASWFSLRLAERIRALGIGCTVVPRSDPNYWIRLIDDPRRFTVVDLELHLGLELERAEYNRACLRSVRSTQRTHVGRRAGFSDLWVPVCRGRRLEGVLVFGPFLTQAPAIESLTANWQSLGGQATNLEDAGFLRYVECAIDSPVYEGAALDALTTFLERVAAVMAGTSRVYSELISEWRRLLGQIPGASMGQLSADLVDPRRHVIWTAGLRSKDLLEEGLAGMPDHVLVAAPREHGEALGTAAVMLRIDNLARACAAFTSEIGNTLCGRVGRSAAFLLVRTGRGRPERIRSRLSALAERLIRFTRRAGLDIACGISNRARTGDELPVRHDEALWAALWGLHSHQRVAFFADAGAAGSTQPSPVGIYRHCRALRDTFSRGNVQQALISAEQTVKDVLWISSGNLEAMRSHFLEIIWELLAITEQLSGMDERTSSDTLADLTARIWIARSPSQLTTTFTAIVRELFDTTEQPSLAGRKAKLDRAKRLVIEAKAGDPVTLRAIARRVSLSPGHFSRCFHQTYGQSFGRFVAGVRLERGQRLLSETNAPIREIAGVAGFSSASYFVQAFKRATGLTPSEYRATARGRRVVTSA